MGLKPTLNPFDGKLQVTLDPYLDDNYNGSNMVSPLNVSETFSSNDTLNQWVVANASTTSTIAFSAGKLVITRVGAFNTTYWMNRNAVGRNCVVSADIKLNDTSANIATRMTDGNNFLTATLSTAGNINIYTQISGVLTNRVGPIAIPSFDIANTYRVTVKVYDATIIVYVQDPTGAVVLNTRYNNAVVSGLTGTIVALGTGSTGTDCSFDNYKFRKIQGCTNMVALGDSNVIGQIASYRCPPSATYTNLLAKKYINDDFLIYNDGVVSRQTTDVNSKLSTELYAYYVNRARNVATLLIGINDITTGAKSAADTWTDMQTLCANILNNGWELFVFTYFPREDDATSNATIKAFNALVRAGADTYGYRVFDLWDMFVDKSDDTNINKTYCYEGDSQSKHINETAHSMIYTQLKKIFYKLPIQPLVITEQIWPIRRVEILDHDKASLMRLYHDNTNAIYSTSTGYHKFSSAGSEYMFGEYGKLGMATDATGNGQSIFAFNGVTYPAIDFRVIPSANSNGFNVYGENYMSFFEIHAENTSATRYVIGMPETAASGIITISRASSPRPFIWAFATDTTAKVQALKLARYGVLTLTTSAPASDLTASTENISFHIDSTATKTWDAGAITTQRESVFLAPTYAFASASTITTAATLAVAGAPTAGSNATITNNYAFWVQDGTAKFDGNIQQGSRRLGVQGVDVASANDITLGNANYFDITGTTEIQRILGTGWTAGSIVILQFDDSVTVKHNVAAGSSYYGFQLAGAADFSATLGDTLRLVFDGAWWREISRAAI